MPAPINGNGIARIVPLMAAMLYPGTEPHKDSIAGMTGMTGIMADFQAVLHPLTPASVLHQPDVLPHGLACARG